MDRKSILGIVRHPIVQFKKRIEDGEKGSRRIMIEDTVFLATADMSYVDAYRFLKRVVAQPVLKGYEV